MAEAWGPWIEHDGKGCPCAGRTVEAVFLEAKTLSNSNTGEVVALLHVRESDPEVFIAGVDGGGSWDWKNWPKLAKVLRFRIRKPDALLSLIDLAEQVEDLTPETVKALVGV